MNRRGRRWSESPIRLYAFDEKELTPEFAVVADLDAYFAEHAESMLVIQTTSGAVPSSFERVCPDAGG